MRTYDVLITPDAYEDLAGIRDHIAHGLGSPEDARSALHSIRKTVGSLATMPSRTKEVEREPWRSRGVRRILSGRFFVYYRVDEDADTVYVLNVLYARGNQMGGDH
ncbi:MAG: type II toxin-antitoxin system RelE/ParE family toxin [Atopobiaceae bacterium]|nr:type II toxin-antitoxin system RelE/ParE family toxin [Atopobiaceae bacterium]